MILRLLKSKKKFDIIPLPSSGSDSAPTLGGWNLAVSKYSQNQDKAIKLVKYLTSKENQKFNAITNAKLPTIPDIFMMIMRY